MMTRSEDVEAIYPLSPMQEGMLFHTLQDPEAGLYVNQAVYLLEGPLEITAFARSWQQVSDRHAVLRTAFVWQNDHFRQVAFKRSGIPLTQEDWRHLSKTEHEERLGRCLREDLRRGFLMTHVPLMRLGLFHLHENAWYFLWSHHHALMDGWSGVLLLKEFLAYYNAFRLGSDLDLPKPREYRDYIAWLQRQDRLRAEAYWRASLAGFTAPTPLPWGGAFSDPDGASAKAEQGFNRASLSAASTANLRRIAAKHRITLNTIVQGMWMTLLGRNGQVRDVVFGATIAGRPADLQGVDAMVGLFISTLPVRGRVEPGAEIIAWLQALQAEQAEARQFDYVSLVDIQGWSEVPRGLPLFESLLAFESYAQDAFETRYGEQVNAQEKIGALTLRTVRTMEMANYPLTLTVGPGEELDLMISYDRRRFSSDAVDRLLSQLQLLLTSFTGELKQRLSDLEWLRPAERRQLLYDWNQTEAPLADRLAVEWFERQVAAHPDAVAVAQTGAAWSYDALNRFANRIAARLRALGVGPERRVGVCLERSAELVAALLGVLKAGGVYAPLDPAYPRERLEYMATESQPGVLLSARHLAGLLPAHPAARLWVEELARRGEEREEENRASGVGPRNLAYVIYTSGSTGKPKGAMIEHRGMNNHLQAKVEELGLGREDSVAQNAPSSFDISVWQMLAPLVSGGRVWVVDDQAAGDAERLAEQTPLGQLTVLETVPAMLAAMVAEDRRRSLKGLRWLICNAEALPTSLCRQWLDLYESVKLINAYGPTECSDDVTHFYVSEEPRGVPYAPLGRPLRNARLFVLDENLEPAPIGVRGEVLIGGPCVGRGYFNRPALTAERYLPDPFSREPGARLYRIGDLGRFWIDGNLEFLGRMDHQVKIRGQRIETGEIEALLNQRPDVRQAVVVVREDAPGDKRLVAYLSPQRSSSGIGGVELSSRDLRECLRSWLPEYMVPAAFVILETLPLTPNGKVDRQALPAPEEGLGAERSDYLAPRNELEELLAGVWCEVLQVERVGIEENFFDLGGHSLLATQVISRARRLFGVEMTLRTLFERQTVARLAAEVQRALDEGSERSAAPPLVPTPRDVVLPLSHAQQRIWFIDQLEPGKALYHIPFALQLGGQLDRRALASSLSEIVARHEVLRTSFPDRDGVPYQNIEPPPTRLLPLVDIGSLRPGDAERMASSLAQMIASRPFDLSRGPLFRFILLRLADQQHILLATLHHLVADGWSMGILASELTALYGSFAERKPCLLPELPLQYADFAVWQRAWLQGQELERQLGYWRERLEGLSPLDLPTDFVRPPAPSYQGGVIEFQLSADLGARIRELGRLQGVTVFMVLLAGWQILLGRYAGQSDVTVGTPIANRTRLEIEDLIGVFVNMLALRGRWENRPSFQQILNQVRQTVLGAYAHQDLPFERLVDELQTERDLSRSPLFQVMLVFQNAPKAALSLGGLEISRFHVEQETAQFELSLNVIETGEGALKCELEYAKDLFTLETVTRLAGHFERLLESAVSDPQRLVSQLELLSPAQRQQLIVAWNTTQTPWEPEVGVQTLFERQVARQPEAIAIVYQDRQLSYAALNARANQLAHHLRALGVGPETVVGVCLERGPAMVISLLGVLKAGGAYLPLDPGYPAERLAYLVADSGASLILTEERSRRTVGEQGIGVLNLDQEWDEIEKRSERNPEVLTGGENLAYVIYTSGSTGQPKGVGVLHSSLSNFLLSMIQHLEFDSGQTLLAVTTLSFDIAGLEIYAPLLTGGCLAVAARSAVNDGESLAEWLERTGAYRMQATPATWQLLLNSGWRGKSGLQVLCGGEALGRQLASDLLVGGHQLWNLYGPTETTIWSSIQRVADSEVTPSIGTAIANTQLYVLDEEGEPVPAGVPGELFIGGAGLARGYVRRPASTAERFVPDPFSPEPGARLYRTGDRVRWSADGRLEYLGRLDHQVKLRGYRIELGEIESVLAHHSGVQQAVVSLWQATGSDPRLVAYIVPTTPETAPSLAELRTALKIKLPDYMIPGALVVLDRLPLTSSGKVNRKALPPPETAQMEADGYVAPQTATEELLAGIWSAVLGHDRISIHSNFFDLGGHSLLATQVASRIRKELSLEFQLRTLFEAPTIAQLAERLDQFLASQPDREHPVTGIMRTTWLVEEALLARLDELPEEEIDRLFSQMSFNQ